MARVAKTLPIAYLISQVWPVNDRKDVISVSLSLATADGAAVLALPVVPEQHSLAPREVLGVNVATLVGVGSRLVTPDLVHPYPRRLERWHSLWHYSPCCSSVFLDSFGINA